MYVRSETHISLANTSAPCEISQFTNILKKMYVRSETHISLANTFAPCNQIIGIKIVKRLPW